MMTREKFLEIIRTNIAEHIYHLTLVNGGQHPDFSYSIGLIEQLGFELIIGGGFDTIKNNELIFRHVYQQLKAGFTLDSQFVLNEDVFYLAKVHASWSEKLMLGVYDYYNLEEITAYQIIPMNKTLDTPLMYEERTLNDPIWKWLDAEWDIDAPNNSYVTTDFDALKGKTIIELVRWGENHWEMFSGPGPDVTEENVRIVPLGTMLGIDNTLQPIVNLAIEEGLWRDSKESSWQEWV